MSRPFPRAFIFSAVFACVSVSTGMSSVWQSARAQETQPLEADTATTEEIADSEGKGPDSEGKGPDSEGKIEAGVNEEPDPLYLAEVEKRKVAYEDATKRLREAILAQRKVSILYLNEEVRNPAARREYFERRADVLRLVNETYDAALDFARVAGDIDSATFMLTWIDHRLKFDIYDEGTLEGATRLIDGGSNLVTMFQAAARSAMVTGRFDIAKKLYEVLDEERKDDVDKSLEHYMDDYQKAYEVEQETLKREAAEDRLPRVKLETTQGDVVIELFIDQAPSTVSNFIQLVEQGFYDEQDFYQVISKLLALTGDPTGLGSGNSGKFIVDENNLPEARGAFRGSLMMAKIPAGEPGVFVPDTASSQFAITFLPVLTASKNQTVFGRVIEGMDAISRMRRVDPSKEKKKDAIVQPPDRIIKATMIRRPDELPEVKYSNPGLR